MKPTFWAGIGAGLLFDISAAKLLPGENAEAWIVLAAAVLLTWAFLKVQDYVG